MHRNHQMSHVMKRNMKHLVTTVVMFLTSTFGYPASRVCGNYPFQFVSREQWGAREPSAITRLTTPVPYVVIHHTYLPGVCMTTTQCMQDMRSMQNTHQITNGWVDIGYNFAVGGEGSVYEGRGWDRVGAHASGWNSNSIGIVLIGDWVANLPPAQQRQTAQQLIDVGVSLGYIRPDYILIGHRQVVATECPGDKLFREISSWKNFKASV